MMGHLNLSLVFLFVFVSNLLKKSRGGLKVPAWGKKTIQGHGNFLLMEMIGIFKNELLVLEMTGFCVAAKSRGSWSSPG